jgi:putative hydrolase of the HAD superfamily
VPIETVFLDAGGVLVFPNWDRVSATFARHGLSVSAAALRAAEPQAKFAMDEARRVATTSDADRGSAYFRLVLAKAGVPADARIETALDELWDYHSEHNLWEHVPANVLPALQALAALGVRLAVASNANGALQRMFDRVGLTPHFHAICDSCVEGVEKPDPRFFQIVLERSGGRPESTVHIGDLYHVDVVGARAAGLQAVLLDPHELYAGYDVQRFKSLDQVVEHVESMNTARK